MFKVLEENKDNNYVTLHWEAFVNLKSMKKTENSKLLKKRLTW